MTHSQLQEKIEDLGYKGLKESYERQCEDINYTKMSFEERLYQLLDAQDLFLKNKKITMNHRLSKIKDKQAALDAIEYNPKRHLDKAQIQSLAQLNFITAKQNIIITGKTGTGKSYLAQAYANHAIHYSYKVSYVRMPSLLEEIRLARIDGTYINVLKKYSRFQLLVLDDFGVIPMADNDATNLFEIIEDRTSINSTIITSQLPVSEWYNYLNNNTVADAILDRIVHSSHRIQLSGPSMRKINSLAENVEY
ncbi:IS21-like element helper ATPase IstB [Candidatus Sulfurimonas baltica]|uniref:ATP-binding protein n=1 Tax=Candidatus Sulfurimonas baltica TaxID=2740404 RepID=A0A7S7LW72_9BACT|nr:IS21-like element helper ATPase IstB [Candidatus Sulfurimonas baltica]QOY52491.1 ATP-binding protein [Candidatus Sulfurimonas baltica]